jgi:hypothetical protein
MGITPTTVGYSPNPVPVRPHIGSTSSGADDATSERFPVPEPITKHVGLGFY